jgi:hypothetical protein
MKTLTLLLLFAATPAFAGDFLHCKENGSVIDNGYEALFNSAQTKAFISQQSTRGAQPLAKLNCEKQLSSPAVNEMRVIANCSEPLLRDAGYSLILAEGNNPDEISAKLYSITFAGEKLAANMTCRYLLSF